MVSRNTDKMKEKLSEITSKVKTMQIVADFHKLQTLEEYHEQIGKKLQDKDVGILVANAGFANVGPFLEQSDDEIERMLQINSKHVVYLMKIFANKLIDRHTKQGTKSAIIVTSSMASTFPMAGHDTYCASKTFASYMAVGLNFELQGKVDVLSYEPAGVATKMLQGKKDKYKGDFITCSTDRAADVCVRDLGNTSATTGAFRHVLLVGLLDLLPRSILNPMMYPVFKKTLLKVRARQEKEKK